MKRQLSDQLECSTTTDAFINDNHNNILIIGVAPGEDGFHDRFHTLIQSHRVVFADICGPAENDQQSYNFIKGNFNSTEHLEELSARFPARFSLIISDGAGTTKFLHYTSEHIKILQKALAPNGKLILDDIINIDFYNDNQTHVFSQNSIVISKEESNDLNILLSKVFESGKVFLDPIKLPSSMLAALTIDRTQYEDMHHEIELLANDLNTGVVKVMEAAGKLIKSGISPQGIINRGTINMHDLNYIISHQLKVKEFAKQQRSDVVQKIKDTLKAQFEKMGVPEVKVQDLNADTHLFKPKDSRDTEYIDHIMYEIPALIGDTSIEGAL